MELLLLQVGVIQPQKRLILAKNKKDTINTIDHLYENASFDDVIDISKFAINKFPCYEFYKALALSYTDISDFNNGFYYLTKAFEYNQDGHLYICQGILFEINSELDNSLESFKKSLKFNSNIPEIYNHIVRILQKLDRFEESKEYSKKALELNSSFNEATITLENTILKEVTCKNHKVFCIGFNRTGSTSTGEALKILGYNVKGEVKK